MIVTSSMGRYGSTSHRDHDSQTLFPGESPKAEDPESSLSTAYSFETHPGNYLCKNSGPALPTGMPCGRAPAHI